MAKDVKDKPTMPMQTTPALSDDSPLHATWAQVSQGLRKEYGDAAFKSWFSLLHAVDIQDQRIILSAPTRFTRDWVMTHYAARILALWKEELPSLVGIEVHVKPLSENALAPVPSATHIQDLSPPPSFSNATANSFSSGFEEIEREPLAANLDPRFTFDHFIVGKTNELAHAAARRVAESTTVPFNPLFLYGGVGLGKTHLMHAIAWHIKLHHPERKVIYLSAEKFMYQFIKALRFKDTMAFKDQFRSVDVLMIDDVQFISGKESTQEEFFHTFNALVDQNRQLIISADKSPSDLEGIEERMKSRLGWGLVADIHPTTYELRLGILAAKADLMKVEIPSKVLEFLAHKITSNVRELEGALNRIAAHATLVGRDITIDSAQDVLRDLLRANDRRTTIEEIQKKVAEHFQVRVSDMHSPKRLRAIARPRQISMYLSKLLTSRSLPEIGRKFGGRDHTTVMHAISKVEELAQTDSSFAEDIDLLRRMLEN